MEKRSAVPYTILAVTIVAFNALVALPNFLQWNLFTSKEEAIGYTFGRVVLVPLMVAGLFQVWPPTRNLRSFMKLVFWVSVVVLLTIGLGGIRDAGY